MSTLADTIAVSGQVRGYDRTPIHMIEVIVYRDTRFVARVYTNGESPPAFRPARDTGR